MSSSIPYTAEKISPTIRSVDTGYATTSYGNFYGGNDERAIAGKPNFDDVQGDLFFNPQGPNLFDDTYGNTYFRGLRYIVGSEGRPLTGTGLLPVKIGGTISVARRVLYPSSPQSSGPTLKRSSEVGPLTRQAGESASRSSQSISSSEGTMTKEEQSLDDSIYSFLAWQSSLSKE